MKPPSQEPDKTEKKNWRDMRWQLLKNYFSKPFPSSRGFSAYRTPGLAAHAPILISGLCLAAAFCLPFPAMWFFIPVYLAAGLYGGRDVAVFCHYAPILTLVVWTVFFALLATGPDVFRFLQARPPLHLTAALSVNLTVLAAFAFHVLKTIRTRND